MVLAIWYWPSGSGHREGLSGAQRGRPVARIGGAGQIGPQPVGHGGHPAQARMAWPGVLVEVVEDVNHILVGR